MKEFDNAFYEKGFTLIAGMDEAGRGPLAGPVCAAAVILPQDCVIEGINDSKKLSEKKRDKLFDEIIDIAVAYGIGYSTPEVIDAKNIKIATHMAMEKAVNALSCTPEYIIIDGNDNMLFDIPCEYIVKGDLKSQSIAAASILAKVSRDRLMKELDVKFPMYGLAKHKGYGTAFHMQAIREYGVSEIHRKSFMTNKVLGK